MTPSRTAKHSATATRTGPASSPAILAPALLCALFALSCWASASAVDSSKTASPASVPQLGEDVPGPLLKRASATKPCPVGDGHFDPCSTLTVGRDRVTVAWDAATHRVTFLYSTTLSTDNDIRAGDVLEIEADSPLTPFPAPGEPHRFVTSDWCDTDSALTGDAEWCAVMLPTRPRSGRVIGFVQSLYLYMPDFDPGPMHRVSLPQRSHRVQLRAVLRRLR